MPERSGERLAWIVAALVLGGSRAPAEAAGLGGGAWVRLPGGGIGSPIAGVALTFVSEDGTRVAAATTNAAGRYAVDLSPARYYVRATHADYEDYASAPGFAVVSGGSPGTMNVFLREPQVTTVLLVRHAEKLHPDATDPAEPLSAAGAARANALRDLLFRAGVSAIYSTDTRRTRDTVEPLRRKLQLTTELYASPSQLADTLLAAHRGDVVLVAAHSDTVAGVANALGGAVPSGAIGDFDNLYLVSRAGSAVRVVNLQYAADSTPDASKGSGATLTLLLARQVGGATPPEAQRLLHACRKAGLAAIHVDGGTALVQPLAAAVGLTPQAFTAATLGALLDGLVARPPAGPVLIVGSRDDLLAAVRRSGAEPFPIVYNADRANLIVITRPGTGGASALSLLY